MTAEEELKWCNIAKAAVEAEGFDVKREPVVVGSSYISDSTTSDIDVLVWVDKREFQSSIGGYSFSGTSWTYGGSFPGLDAGGNHWGSWKKWVDGEEVNLLVTDDEEWYWNFVAAAKVCRYLFLKGIVQEKNVRHGIHNILMEDSMPDDELKRDNVLL
jgi:hypothetical protein